MAISYVGGATGTTTVTMPAHQAGDLLVAYAFRDGSTTAPTVPAGWAVRAALNGTTCNGRVAEKFATSSSETSGTWTSATGLVIVVYRGAFGIGGVGTGQAVGTTITTPAMTRTVTDGTSWGARFFGHRTATNLTSLAVTGYTQRAGIATEVVALDSNGALGSNPTADAASPTASASSGWVAITAEILSMPASDITFTDRDFTNTPVPPDTTGAWVTLFGQGANGNNGATPSGSNDVANGGAGGGGGARIGRSFIPVADMGSTFSTVLPAQNVAAVFTSGSVTLSAGSGNTGTTAGTASVSGTTATSANGSAGGGGGAGNPATVGTAGTSNTSGAGSGGGGGGGRRDSTNRAGGAGGTTSGGSPTGVGNGRVGGTANSSAAGDGGGGGGYAAAASQTGGAGRIVIEWIIPDVPQASSEGAYSWSSSATGKKPSKGTSTGSYTWASSATGKKNANATAANSVYSWGSTAVGKTTPKATAGSSYQFATLGAGDTNYIGVTAGSYSWAGTAVGSEPVDDPRAAGTYSWSSTVVGYSSRKGTKNAAYGWVATPVGKRTPKGSAGSSPYRFVGAAAGKRIPKATTTTGLYNFALDGATGHRTGSAFLSSTYRWTSLATGLFTPKPVAGAVGWYSE